MKGLMPMDTDYMFYTQKREKKEKGEKSSEKKMKGMMPMNSSKQRQIRPQCLAIWLNCQYSQLHKTASYIQKYICHTSKTSKGKEWGNNKREKKIPMIRQRQIGGGEARSQWLNMPLLPRPCVPTVVHYNVFCSHSNTTLPAAQLYIFNMNLLYEE